MRKRVFFKAHRLLNRPYQPSVHLCKMCHQSWKYVALGDISQNIQCTSLLTQITHPVGSFTLLVRFFGSDIFVLWKLAMLQKRMLFFSPPPIGVVCYRGNVFFCKFCFECAGKYLGILCIWNETIFFFEHLWQIYDNSPLIHSLSLFQSSDILYTTNIDICIMACLGNKQPFVSVYCTTCLTRHRYTGLTRRTVKPYFYVNIADIEQLERESSYIACKWLFSFFWLLYGSCSSVLFPLMCVCVSLSSVSTLAGWTCHQNSRQSIHEVKYIFRNPGLGAFSVSYSVFV